MDAAELLDSLGIQTVRQQGDEILAHCPQHMARTGKSDRHPSWFFNSERMVFLCFSCGYKGTLIDLYRDMDQEPPENIELELLKIAAARTESVQQDAVEKDPDPIVNEWVLQFQYVDVPQRLLNVRHLTREAVDFFTVRWDRDHKVWVLPMRDEYGVLLGYQFRAKGYEENFPIDVKKSSMIFGLSQFLAQGVRRIAVVESPLDAVRMYSICPTVATMGAWISNEQIELLSRHFPQVISALDNDRAGRQGAELLATRLRRRGCVTFDFDYTGLSGKDPGDESDDDALRSALTRSLETIR